MKLLSYIYKRCGSNIYLIASENSSDVVIIDPVYFDEDVFKLIEQNRYTVSGVLVTRIDEKRTHGLRTILRIYETEVHARGINIQHGSIYNMSDGYNGTIAGIDYRVMETDNYMFFQIGPYVFTGNGFSSGRHCTAAVKQAICSLEDGSIILPGCGPPTTVAAERSWNPQLQEVPVQDV